MALHLFGTAAALLFGGRAPASAGSKLHAAGFSRHAAPSMEILRAQAGASAASVLQFLEYSTAKENMGETVFVLSYTDDFSMSNAVFEQVAETFEASALYNGPPFRAAQIVRGDGGVQDEVAAARGVEQNLVQIWKRGSLIKEVDTFGLETALLAEGLRCAKYPTNTGSGAGGMRERKKTDAADLANAVDDIDFFAGKEGLSKRDDLQFLNRKWKGKTDASGNYINADGTPRRTSDYFPGGNGRPGQDGLPGDEFGPGKKGWSNDPRNGKPPPRNDRPPGMG
jgi:hypothetical protein